jgi:hypothetical protein
MTLATGGSWLHLILIVASLFYYIFLGNKVDNILLSAAVLLGQQSLLLGFVRVTLPIASYGALAVSVWVVAQAWRGLLVANPGPQRRGAGKVLLYPCRTTHSRLFPKRHSFSYSYLTVGIPVGWEGVAGGLVSVGGEAAGGIASWVPGLGRGWFHVDAGDYLERGSRTLGLRGKLDAYLESQVCV